MDDNKCKTKEKTSSYLLYFHAKMGGNSINKKLCTCAAFIRGHCMTQQELRFKLR